MNRLLFAAGRGARIQTYVGWAEEWQDDEYVAVKSNWTKQRIHPADAHLAYGPVSTALREYAEASEFDFDVLPTLAMGGLYKVDWNFYDIQQFSIADDKTRVLFLLILAESLAEEGL